jgi:NADPH:quinone reductase-like Zn-dependent oxidoreductase
MRAAVLHEHGEPPRAGEFDEPTPKNGHVVVDVDAAGLNHLEILKASGGFYTGPPPLPSVVGSDGVGRLADGRRVFFDTTEAPYGAMAERTLVDEGQLFDVPEGVPDELAAALGNSGLVAWLALEWRAQLKEGETVLVLGATGALGNVAVQAAKLMGAGRVVAAARPGERLERMRERGADELVDLETKEVGELLKEATHGGANVIIDPLWGPPALAAMGAAARGARYVQLGHVAAPTLELPAMAVRSVMLDLQGLAIFQAPLDVRRDAYRRLTEHAARGDIEVDIETVPLAEVEDAWRRQQDGPEAKLVIITAA